MMLMFVGTKLRALSTITTNLRRNQRLHQRQQQQHYFASDLTAAARQKRPHDTVDNRVLTTTTPPAATAAGSSSVLLSARRSPVGHTNLVGVGGGHNLSQSRQFASLSSGSSCRTNNVINSAASTMTTTTQRQQRRSLSVQEITANLHLITEQPRNVKHDPTTLRLLQPVERPLVIMPAWLLAKRKPLNKYAEIYLQLGYDVLTIKISPWQLLWPAKGTQLVGQDVVNFLHHNTSFNPLLVHGFSVGAYVWGECLVHISRDMPRYAHIVERIVGQVWDSAADITEIPVGVPKAVFPNNPRLNRALSNYMQYHLRTFHDIATQHYILSSQMFHNNMVRAPALMFVSEDDPVGSVSSNDAVRRDWLRLGIECEWKCWSRSEHVSHFMRHRDEYLATLFGHLERLQVVGQQEAPKLRAKL